MRFLLPRCLFLSAKQKPFNVGQLYGVRQIYPLIVKDSGMRVEEAEKKGGKEDESPTMPLVIFNFYRVIQSWRKGRDFFARLEYKQDGIPSCRGCGHREVVFYDHYHRKAKVASIDGRIYDVIIKARRYRCLKCGSVFREPIRGLKSNKRISENAKDEIIDKYLDGATNKKISKRLGISQSTVERVIHERFELKVKELMCARKIVQSCKG